MSKTGDYTNYLNAYGNKLPGSVLIIYLHSLNKCSKNCIKVNASLNSYLVRSNVTL